MIDLTRALGWPRVVGNTDEMFWMPDRLTERRAQAPQLRDLINMLFHLTAPATAEMLGEERIAWLKTLPTEWRHEKMVVLHASPGDLWRAPMPDADDETLAQVYGSRGRGWSSTATSTVPTCGCFRASPSPTAAAGGSLTTATGVRPTS